MVSPLVRLQNLSRDTKLTSQHGGEVYWLNGGICAQKLVDDKETGKRCSKVLQLGNKSSLKRHHSGRTLITQCLPV